jgi:hypothetical protein
MKIVKENINFERGREPKKTMSIGLRKALEEKGIIFEVDWDPEGRASQRVEDNIEDVYEFAMALINAGVNPGEIRVSDYTKFFVPCYRVMDGNVVKMETISKEDAEILIQVCKDLSVDSNANWRIASDRDEKLIYSEAIPSLKKIQEIRKKYRKIL